MSSPVGIRIQKLFSQGFTLIEVLIALGIVSFTLTAILALYVLGLKSSQDSTNMIAVAHLAGRILAERHANPKLAKIGTQDLILPPLNQRKASLSSSKSIFDNSDIPTGEPIYLKENGTVVQETDPDKYYRLDYVIDAIDSHNPPPAGPLKPDFKGFSRIYLSLSRIKPANNTSNRFELTTCVNIN